MTAGAPDRSPRRPPEQDRARQLALFVLGVAVVLYRRATSGTGGQPL